MVEKCLPILLQPGRGFSLSKRNSLTLQKGLTSNKVSSLLPLCNAQDGSNSTTGKNFNQKPKQEAGDISGGKVFAA